MRDWAFVEAFVRWCGELTDVLNEAGSNPAGHPWRTRDVEMAVFRAWGDRQERRRSGVGVFMDLPSLSPEYGLASGPLTGAEFIVTNDGKPARDAAWFKRKIAELRTELDRLPPDQREQFLKTLKN